MVSAGSLGLVFLHLDDMDLIFSDHHIVATKDMTIAKLIDSVLEGVAIDSAFDTDRDDAIVFALQSQ